MKWWKKSMCRFFESIKVVNKAAVNLDLHEERLNRTRYEFFGLKEKISLKPYVKTSLNLLQKCRIIYGRNVEKIEFIPYTTRIVRSLRIIETTEIQYHFKFLDRSCFSEMLKGISRDSDILIVRNHMITDTSYSNIAFWDGCKWMTPADPLLPGTKREFLLRNGIIHTDEIRLTDLHLFKSAKMINAMLDLEDSPSIEIRNIQ